MKSLIVGWLFLVVGQCLQAQQIVGFEEMDIGLDSALIQGNQIDGMSRDGFISGDVFFPNTYNAEFDFFTEWAISSRRDTISAGPSNSTSAFAGGGEESDTYAVASAFEPVSASLGALTAGSKINGLYITNSTYSALSMINGDAFAKKFGGESGDDPDFFKLTIKKWLNGETPQDSVEFYLADFRFEDNSQDYIIKDWTWVDLESLGGVDSLIFTLTSSDVGAFGMNTPAFFCIDNLNIEFSSSVDVESYENIDLIISPNPAQQFITVLESDGNGYQIFNSGGQEVQQSTISKSRIDVAGLAPGMYVYRSKTGQVGRFIKM